MRPIKLKSGRAVWFPTIEEIQAADDCNEGFCLECGAEGQGAEPDAMKYTCDECGKPAVYGAAEFALRGWVAD